MRVAVDAFRNVKKFCVNTTQFFYKPHVLISRFFDNFFSSGVMSGLAAVGTARYKRLPGGLFPFQTDKFILRPMLNNGNNRIPLDKRKFGPNMVITRRSSGCVNERQLSDKIKMSKPHRKFGACKKILVKILYIY